MKLFTDTLLDELAAKANASPRLRAHHNIHQSPGDLVQRFFVAANRDSYFRPHRHLAKSELAVRPARRLRAADLRRVRPRARPLRHRRRQRQRRVRERRWEPAHAHRSH